MKKCDICGAEKRLIHVTEIHKTEADPNGGVTVQRTLCEVHARDMGLEVSSEEEDAMNMVPRTRELVRFLKTKGRMPSPLELPHRGPFTDLSGEQLGNDELTRRITYLQELADFLERNRRFPTEEELPDRF